jgi:FkbM family methyltransferase
MTIRSGPTKGMKWIAGSGAHGCWLGTFEFDKQTALARFVRPGMTLYDVGASAGFYTLFFSRLAGPTGKVYAFEPFASGARFLLDHVRLNRLRNVRVLQAAVSDRVGMQGFTTDCGLTMNGLCETDDALLQVPTVCLDRLDLPPPDLIKMDVEGGEAAALRGARETLRCHRPVVFVALHGAEQTRECNLLLRELGYHIHILDGAVVTGDPPSDEIYAIPPG